MNRKLLTLNGLAILAVVLNHATGKGFIAMFWWAHRYRPVVSPNYDLLGSSAYYGLVILQQIALFSVPAFLYISGFFVSYAAKSAYPGLSWKVIKSRISSLLWPYIIWSILVFVWNALANDEVLTFTEYLRRLVFGGATGAYFFVPMLCQFYLLSSWMATMAKKRPALLMMLAVICQMLPISLYYLRLSGFILPDFLFETTWLFIRYAVFFPFGLLIGLKSNEVVERFVRYRRVFLGCTIFFFIASIFEYQLIYQFSSSLDFASSPMKISSILYAFCILAYVISCKDMNKKSWRYITMIGALSYGMYLMHPELLTLLSRIIYHVAPGLLSMQWIFTILLFLLGVGITILVMESVKRSPIRKAYRYLFG